VTGVLWSICALTNGDREQERCGYEAWETGEKLLNDSRADARELYNCTGKNGEQNHGPLRIEEMEKSCC